MEELRAIIKDIRSGKDIEKYILVLVALLIGILDIFGLTNQSIINAVILAVLAILVYGRILDRRKQDSLVRGIAEFHINRSTVPTLDATIIPAKDEVFIIGVTLTGLILYQRSLIEDKARKGCKIKIALWIPPSDQYRESMLFESIDSMIISHRTGEQFPVHLDRFRDWFINLDNLTRDNTEIRGYSSMPTLSIIFIDKDSPNGVIHVEPIIYKARPENQPSFRLKPHDSPELFKELSKRYSQLWEDSQVLFAPPEKTN